MSSRVSPRRVFQSIIKTDIYCETGDIYQGALTRWTYSEDAPYEVVLRVIEPRSGVVTEWVFSRLLLSEGRRAASGACDVHVRPDRGQIVVDLSSPSGHASLWMKARDVTEFLDGTFRVRPLETSWEDTLVPLAEPPVRVWAQEVQS